MISKKHIPFIMLFCGILGYAQIPVNDVGILDIISPQSGNGLGIETVSVTVKNYGSNSQSNFNVEYTVDAGAPVIENYVGPIAPNEELTFSFAVQADLSIPASYFIVVRTNLVGDEDQSNDANGTSVVNSCTPVAFEGCFVDGIKRFVLNTIDVDDGADGCNTEPSTSPEGYADRRNFSTSLNNVAGSNMYTLQAQQNWDMGANIEQLSVWIDFNDNNIFEVSERLISGAFFQDFGVLEDFTLTIPVGAALGSHILRAKAIDSSGPGDILDPCTNYGWGETQDYTVVIESVLSIDDPMAIESKINIIYRSDNQFDITLSNVAEVDAIIAIYSLNGQKCASVEMFQSGSDLTANVDLSFAASGIYLVKVVAKESSLLKTEKILVK